LVRVGLEAEAPEPKLLRQPLDLADHVHRLAARIHGPDPGEAVGVLAADFGHLFVRDDLDVGVAEGGEHQALDAGGVHVVDDLLGGHPALEQLERAVALENVDELGGPAIDGAGKHQRGPGVDGSHLL
jgi:hypothetical protein